VLKEHPLWHKLYFWPEYTAVARAVGYLGCTYRDLAQIIEDLAKKFPKVKVESATYHLLTFEGQMTCNPPPLAKVELRAEARKLCWQLLGPPPEKWDEFYANCTDPPPNPYVKPKETTPAKPKRTRKKG
jgi:hypothetical protein